MGHSRYRTAVVCTIAAAIAGAGLAVAFLPYQLDDAYIVYRYAANIADGHGPTFNTGQPAVEGYTSPAWLALLLPAAAAIGNKFLPTMGFLLGSLSALACLGVAITVARRSAAADGAEYGAWAGAIAALALATQPTFTFYAATGMDAPLFLLVVLLFAGAVDGALPLRWGLLSGALAVAVRPEGGWLPVMLAAQLLATGGWKRLFERRTLALVGSVVAGGVVLTAARLIVFGMPLPHTFYAKQSDLSFGWSYVVGHFSGLDALLLLGLAVAGAWQGGTRFRGWLAGALVWIPVAILEGGDWMPAGRFLLPCLGLLSVSAAGLVRSTAAGRKVASGALLLLFGLQAYGSLDLARLARATERGIRREATFVADWIVAGGARSAAVVDIGWLGYRTGVEIVDLGGLTDTRLGRLPGIHLEKRIDPAYVVHERRPDVIVIRIERPPARSERGEPLYHPIAGVERRVLGDPGFAAAYRLEFMVIPAKESRKPYYGRMVFVRNGFVPRRESELPDDVIRLEP